MTSWSSRADVCHGTALDAAELAALVDSSLDASLGMLFTATPREELDEIGRFQRLADQAWAGQVRAIVAAYNRATDAEREFAADEVALALGISPTAGSRLLTTALDVAGLPGLLESVEAGALTQRHALAITRELGLVDLTVEQRHAVALMALARFAGQTPGELAKVVARLVLTVDLAAAQLRRDKAALGRRVDLRGDVDGQATLTARGPLETIAAIKARLTAELHSQNLDLDDPRTRTQREFDLFADLLTGAALDGQPAGDVSVDYSVAVIVPFSTADGGDLELAEIPGLGPVLPSTARDLLQQADTLTQVAVDDRGCVLNVSDAVAGPLRAARESFDAGLSDRLATAPVRQDLSVAGYRVPTRLRRFLEHRDQTCVFPGCHRPATATDKDHRTPWPAGPTSADNLQCLCRHHHRAKQTSFDVELTDEGHLWTTRGGWQFLRRPKGY